MKHLDLFSGIGGFALAARMVGGFETIGFCEIDSYCQRVLAKNFPGIPIYDDIKTFSTNEPIDIITGGYPCQPFSLAGIRKGELDDRNLWPQMFRIVEESRAAWVLCENVVGHISMGIDKVLSDLESIGYTCQSFIIPAVAVDAKHRRDRVWIVANAPGVRPQGGSEKPVQRIGFGEGKSAGSFENFERLPYPPQPGVLRNYHGIPNGVDRIKALGNAIVPQVAAEILRAIKSAS